jgi:hypothetical protein
VIWCLPLASSTWCYYNKLQATSQERRAAAHCVGLRTARSLRTAGNTTYYILPQLHYLQ